jgi:hypothetical protein
MRFDTLDQLVKDICEIGGGDMQHKNYGSVLKLCVRTLQDLNLFTQIPNYKTVELEVRGNLTAVMPNDVLRPIKIGKCVNGKLVEVRYSADICMPLRGIQECCECEEEVKVYETVEVGSEGGGTGLCDYTALMPEFCSYQASNIFLVNRVCFTFPSVFEVNDEVSKCIYFDVDIDGFVGTQDELVKCSQGSLPLTGGFVLSVFSEIAGLAPSGDEGHNFMTSVGTELTRCLNYFKGTFNGEFGLETPVYIRISKTENVTNLDDISISFLKTYDGNVTITEDEILIEITDFIKDRFQVNINGDWVDKTVELTNGAWSVSDSRDDITAWRIVDEDGEPVGSETPVQSTCSRYLPEGYILEVFINNEWVDVTDEVDGDRWERLQSADNIGLWRVVQEAENEDGLIVIATGSVESDCDDAPIPSVSYQRLKSIESRKPACDTKGKCNTCKKPQKTATAPGFNIDTRFIPESVLQGNLVANLDAFYNFNNVRSIQRFTERFGEKPYPALAGWFNYDLVQRIIKLDGNWSEGDCLLFMYKTEMQELDGTKVVPVECFKMLLYACKEMLWSRNRPDMATQRQLFETEYNRIRRLYNKMTVDEWEAAMYGYRNSSIKR